MSLHAIHASAARAGNLRGVVCAVALLSALARAHADAPPATAPAAGLAVGGDVDKPLSLSAADLAAMPRHTVQVKDHDGSDASYDGVALRDVLIAAGVPLGQHRTRGPQLSKFVLATSADHYHVLFALAELDADYAADKLVLVADRRNGQPLDAKSGPLRLVVPGEGMQGRWARQLITVEVKSAVEPPQTQHQ